MLRPPGTQSALGIDGKPGGWGRGLKHRGRGIDVKGEGKAFRHGS